MLSLQVPRHKTVIHTWSVFKHRALDQPQVNIVFLTGYTVSLRVCQKSVLILRDVSCL
jgi:hypothetical protein